MVGKAGVRVGGGEVGYSRFINFDEKPRPGTVKGGGRY